jgi:hypothetical protein
MEHIAPVITALVWPLTILICAVLFRGQLKSFFESFANRNFEAGPTGVKATLPTQPSGKTEALKDSAPATIASTPGATSVSVRNEVRSTRAAENYMEPYKKYISEIEDLARKNIDSTVNSNGKTKEDTLVYFYVDAYMNLHMERASRFVFGSQLTALSMACSSSDGVALSQIRSVYDASGAAAHITFDVWLSFLTTWSLLEFTNDLVKATAAGKCLIPYMQWRGYLQTWPAY